MPCDIRVSLMLRLAAYLSVL
jgi:hypothetical protein